MPDFRIKATPAHRVVSPGAVVAYWLDRDPGIWSATMTADWTCINDPQTTSWYQPSVHKGPTGLAWKDAKWEFQGHHKIGCRVYDSATQEELGTVTYDQDVASLDAVLQAGPVLPLGPQDPAAYLDVVARGIENDLAEAKRLPPQGAVLDRHNDQISHKQAFRDKLKEKLSSSAGAVRHPVAAKHFDIASQEWSRLHVFVAQLAPDSFVLIDWTNPTKRELTSEHTGDTLRSVIDDWCNGGNRYPNGKLYLSVEIPGSPKIDEVCDTTGSTFWDDVSTYLTWFGLGSIAVAASVGFLSPIPGPQIASAAVWAAVFSSIAAATINIVQRHKENFPDWRADTFDALSVVSCLLGVAGAVWVRGAAVLVPIADGSQVLRGIFIGKVAADGLQGVVLADQHFDQYEKIRGDNSLTPGERNQQIMRLLLSSAASSALIYLNVRGTKADLENLNIRPKAGGETPQEKLNSLSDPKKTVDMTEKTLTVEGHGAQGEHTTTVQVDSEQQAPHVSGQTGRATARGFEPPPPAAKRGLRPENDGVFKAVAKKKKWILIVRDSNAAAAERIGKPGFEPKPEKVKAKTLKQGQGKAENIGLAAANPNDPALIRMLEKDKQTFEQYKTTMDGQGFGIDEANDYLVFRKTTKAYLYSDADLHGVYDAAGNKVGYSKAMKDELNRELGVDLIQHGPQDEWDLRYDVAKAGDNAGPKVNSTAYLPDGTAQHLTTIAEMKQFYLEHGIPWDDIWEGHY